MCRAILRASVNHPGAMYIRLGRGRDPEVYRKVPEPEFGKAIWLRDGKDLTIITCSSQVRAGLDAAIVLDEQGVSTRVIDMRTISQVDVDEICDAAKETGAILTVEDHNITGGLGSSVVEMLIDLPRIAFKRHGVPDKFVEIDPPAALYAHYKLDKSDIVEVAQRFLKEKSTS
ncbi:MAG: hypothetical protein JKX91_06850 [Rhizobiaceae bacterium]|nr:hypothetical protein [Rhizobiaceae bacterium]